MNIHQFANMLNGREYMNEITKPEEQLAKELGFVVVFGYSDDNAEFRGAIHDEIDCYEGKEIFLDGDGILQPCNCKHGQLAKSASKTIEAVWCDPEYFIDGEGGYAWTYKADIPHATFDIMEDGEKYCRGIVFDIKELEGKQ